VAPEIFLSGRTGNPATDIWSLGCTLIELFTRRVIWSFKRDKKSLDYHLEKAYEAGRAPHALTYCRAKAHYEILSRCVDYKAENRPTSKVIMEHFVEAKE